LKAFFGGYVFSCDVTERETLLVARSFSSHSPLFQFNAEVRVTLPSVNTCFSDT